MQAAIVHCLATGGANGRRPGLRRGGGMGTLRTCGGGEAAAWGGAERSRRRRRGRREPEAEAGPWARGAASSRGCTGLGGCASHSGTPSGAYPLLPGTVTVRTWPCGGDCDAPARGGRRRRRVVDTSEGWEGGRGGERRHLDRRSRWGCWWRRASVDQPSPRQLPVEEVGGRCQLRDYSRWWLQCCALGWAPARGAANLLQDGKRVAAGKR